MFLLRIFITLRRASPLISFKKITCIKHSLNITLTIVMPNMNSVDYKLRDEYVLLEVDKYKVSVSLTLDSKVISAT